VGSSRKRGKAKDRRSGGPPSEPLPDALILAAVERAERHRSPRPAEALGVSFRDLVEHLGLVHSPWTTRRMRPDVERLRTAGLLARTRRQGSDWWSLTPAGRRRLTAARRGRVVGELPESPQHRRWREARRQAERRIGGFRDEVRRALADADAQLGAGEAVGSDAWFDVADRLKEACWRLGSATHCLHEWSEPDDRRPDRDDLRGSGDKDLDREERGRREWLRMGRRNTWAWNV
jgi:hypothetical protein